MNVFLTGAAGRLGRAVARTLADQGFQVVGADRQPAESFPGRFVQLDLLDEGAVRDAMAGCQAVVHVGNYPNVGAGPSPLVVYRENVAMNANVFEAAVVHGIRQWVFASSIQVCCGGRLHKGSWEDANIPYLPLDGHMPARPFNLYALSKLAGEELMAFHVRLDPALSAVSLRFPFLTDDQTLKRMRWILAHHVPSQATIDEAFSYLSTRDAAQLIACILRRPPAGFRTWLPAARGNKLGLPAAEVVDRYYSRVPLRCPREQLTSLVDTTEIERVCGWQPRDNHLFEGSRVVETP